MINLEENKSSKVSSEIRKRSHALIILPNLRRKHSRRQVSRARVDA